MMTMTAVETCQQCIRRDKYNSYMCIWWYYCVCWI